MIKEEDYLDLENYYMSNIRHACISVAVDLGIFEEIHKGAMHSHILSERLSLNIDVLNALIESLKSLGFLSPSIATLSLTTKSLSFLLKEGPFYQGDEFLRKKNSDIHDRIKKALIKGGGSLEFSGQAVTQMWQSSSLTSEAAMAFTSYMQTMMAFPANYHAINSSISGINQIIDVGGGSGAWAMALKKQNPAMDVGIFDLPEVILAAKKIIESQNFSLQDFSYYSGSFFSDQLPQAQAFLLSNILHDWPIKDCVSILRNIHRALVPSGTLYIHECLLDEGRTSPIFTSLFNLLMSVNHNSQQFTKTELNSILKSNGFSGIKPISKIGYYTLFSCEKI